MRFELTTSTLARLRSTPELHPLETRRRNIFAPTAVGKHLFAPLLINLTVVFYPVGILMVKATQTALGMATTDDLFALLDKLNIPTKTHFHRPVRTVDENRSFRGTLPGTHTKTLFFKDKKKDFWLCAMEETVQLDIGVLSDLLGSARLSFASVERVKSKLGVEPGAISPFALINNPQNDINMIFDASLMLSKVVNFHPLLNDCTTAINPNDLIIFLQALGHNPVHVDLGPTTDKK